MAVRELLADLLAAHGFEVSAAETAEQAEAQAAHESFDLLLSDIDLPGMSGARSPPRSRHGRRGYASS